MILEDGPFDDYARMMKGEYLRTPLLQRLVDPQPRKALLIGSCLTNYVLRKDLWCPSDLLLFNGGALQDLQGLVDGYDFVLLQIPLRAILRDGELWQARHDHAQDFEAAYDRARQLLCEYLDTCLRDCRHKPVFVGNFLVPVLNPAGRLLPRYDLRNLAYFVQRLNEDLERLLQQHNSPQLHLLDMDAIANTVGKRFLSDEFHNALNHAAPGEVDWGHELCPEESRFPRFDPVPAAHRHWDMQDAGLFGKMVSHELQSMLHTLTHATQIKLVVVDLDNTLWRGVASEEAEQLAGGMPAHVNRAFFNNFGIEDGSLYRLTEGYGYGITEALHYCKRRGILLGILSKNTHDDTVRNIERIYHGKLSLDNFVSVKINWEAKAENMRQMLSELNLLPGNVLFIDDNPLERAQMSAAFPDMPIIGRWIKYVKTTLHNSLLTDVPMVSAESAQRTEMLRGRLDARHHQAMAVGNGQAAGLQGLQIAIKVWALPADPAHAQVRRALELLNKTNQFNLNGMRLSADSLQKVMADGCQLLAMEGRDKFTAHGLVGVALVNRHGVLVQWAISCRVLGLQVEAAFLSELMRLTQLEQLVLHYQGTEKNFPLSAWVKKHCQHNQGLYVLARQPVPEHVQLDGKADVAQAGAVQAPAPAAASATQPLQPSGAAACTAAVQPSGTLPAMG